MTHCGVLKGCGLLAGTVFLAVVALVAWLVWTFNGGPASAEDLRPLPPRTRVVDEGADCPGNGNGWKLCSRVVRLQADGTDSTGFRDKVAAHYRAQGHRLERLPDTDEYCRWSGYACEGTVLGEPGCLAVDPSPRVRCFYVAEVRRAVDDVTRPPVPEGALDIDIRTYDYLR